ncbi:hypothetical protein [Niveibacterium microcysteis]|uniref:Porin n=1 Tax=Niveibacterium microcysteis TaxID=2811415 RepID=A0ABX7MA15_9RHOO|nr:hypothetical protein [Niveibacterium microcysteis]QSI76337.1 hypothetical protein JY500_17995 [Niveibacterium microcysteis]
MSAVLKTRVVLAALCLASGVAVRADESPDRPWRLAGFGTLGGTWASADGIEYRRDVTQAPTGVAGGAGAANVDTRIGVQFNYQLGADWEAVVQALSRYRYDGSWRPELSWGFLSYSPDAALTLRGGRLGLDVYPLADSTNIGYSYLPVRPAPDYYGGIPMQSLDGLDVSYIWPLGADALKFKAYAGLAVGKAVADAQGAVFDLADSPLVGAYLEYQGEPWTARLGYTQIRVAHDFPFPDIHDALRNGGIPGGPELADRLSVEGKHFGYLSASLGYQQGALQAQLAGSYFRSDSDALPPYYAGFALLGYRVGALTPYLLLSGARSPDSHPVSGLPPWPMLAPLENAVGKMFESNLNNLQTVGLGTRWDLSSHIALKLQAERIHGTHSIVLWFNDAAPGDAFKTTVLSAVLDFVF